MKSKKNPELVRKNLNYIGRFAPSPTGGLHFGSLVTAGASYLQAKTHGGKWHLRIEDLDPPREEPRAKDKILKTLEAYHLFWDESVVYQSANLDLYQEALNQLDNQNLIFQCACTRNYLKPYQIYPGFCQNKNLSPNNTATRLKVSSRTIKVHDLVQADKQWHLTQDIGDFIIKRKDGFFAYQIAVVVDDDNLGVTEVVRGVDLINETPKQIYLQQCLNLRTPTYGHVPLVRHTDGDKLSKQTHAPELRLDQKSIGQSVFKMLVFLGQNPPAELEKAKVSELWEWGIMNWNITKLKKT